MSYAFFMIGCCFGIPFIVMSVCNVLILRNVRASRLRVKTASEPQQSPASIKNFINRLTIGSTKVRMISKIVPTYVGKSTTTLHTPSSQSTKSSLTRQQRSRFLHLDWKPASENTPPERCSPVTAISLDPSSDVSFVLPSNSETEFNAQGPVHDKQMSKQKGLETPPLKRREEIRLAVSLIIVVVIFVICWLPYCVSMLLSIFHSGHVPREFHMFTIIIGYANSCCNPIIYGVMNKRFKVGFKRIFCFWQYRTNSGLSSP
ncbi:hypothetical protein DPMN_192300 [Dreissena polymorpha]|uniref:G-protein coupled receptors family 1 profile domain-containing protein n=2 Tax=Dreissena polymorpha TaxID=45954 RepID=A0A9D3Y2A0_DREPO|nr:hypothetical protein DPMN_192300 [Dreissena polymorpha]